MPHRKWSFIINPFLVAGTRNYKKGYELAKYTDAALNARTSIPFFAALYATFHALFVALETEYNDWKSQGGIQEGATLGLDQLLKQLGFGDSELGITSKISDWDLDVQIVHRKGTPDYTAIFPQGHKPFQTGSKDSRIAAVAALSVTLAGYPALAALKATVDAFLTSLNDARLEQQGEISDTGTDSDEVRAAIEAAMIGMFAVYGALIEHFAATPDAVEAFFDLELLRSLQQIEFTGTDPVLTYKNIVKRTLDNDRRIKLRVDSSRELRFFVADEKNDEIINNSIVVPGGEEVVIPWGGIKNSETATYLKVYNGADDVEGHYTVEILPEGFIV